MIWQISFWNFITSFVAVGGGSTLLSYFYDLYVIKLNVISNSEFLNISVISQILPGPVALSFLAVVGFKVANIWGWILSICSFAITTSFLTHLFYKYAFKFKWLEKLTNYLIVILMGSLLIVLYKMLDLPFKYAMLSNVNILKLLVITFICVIGIIKKIPNMYLVLINLILSLLFVTLI